jgi:hypothetical protein
MAQFACFECLRIALVEANKKSTKTLVKHARRAGWLQQEGPRGGRGCRRGEEAHFGPELVDVPWLAGPGCASTLDLRPSPCSLQSPFAVPSPLVELFPPPTSALRAFPLFPQHLPRHPGPVHNHAQPRSRPLTRTRFPDLHRVLHGLSRPPPSNISLACSPRASLLGGHQTLTSLHPIRHGSRPAATTRASGHHNASQSPTPPRLTAEPGQFPRRLI